ncbi:hypothetical protein Zm00014a_035682 [Zea mays]
MYKAN